jgi:hypothetical protein
MFVTDCNAGRKYEPSKCRDKWKAAQIISNSDEEKVLQDQFGPKVWLAWVVDSVSFLLTLDFGSSVLTVLNGVKGLSGSHFTENVKSNHLEPLCHIHPLGARATFSANPGNKGIYNFGHYTFLLEQRLGGEGSRQRSLHPPMSLRNTLASNAQGLETRPIHVIELAFYQDLLARRRVTVDVLPSLEGKVAMVTGK